MSDPIAALKSGTSRLTAPHGYLAPSPFRAPPPSGSVVMRRRNGSVVVAPTSDWSALNSAIASFDEGIDPLLLNNGTATLALSPEAQTAPVLVSPRKRMTPEARAFRLKQIKILRRSLSQRHEKLRRSLIQLSSRHGHMSRQLSLMIADLNGADPIKRTRLNGMILSLKGALATLGEEITTAKEQMVTLQRGIESLDAEAYLLEQ